MPFGDGTGPMGMGPMTGRAAGYCAGYDAPGFANPIRGGGLGLGLGRGGGWWHAWPHRRWHYAAGLPGRAWFGYAPTWGYGAYPSAPTPSQAEFLKKRAEWLQQELDAINQRIAELEKAE